MGWVQINARLLQIARETYRFLRSPDETHRSSLKGALRRPGCRRIVSAASRDLYYPRESFRYTLGGGEEANDGRDSQVTFPHHPSRHSRPSHSRMAFSVGILDIFHSTSAPTCAEPRVFHYLSRKHCVLATRIVAYTLFPRWKRGPESRRIYFPEMCLLPRNCKIQRHFVIRITFHLFE